MIPIFPVRRKVLFPGILFHCAVARPEQVLTVLETIRGRKWLAALPVRSHDSPPGGQASAVCLARIRSVQFMPDGGLLITILGIARAHILSEVPRGKPYRFARIELMDDAGDDLMPPDGWLKDAHAAIGALRAGTGESTDPYPPTIWLDLLCHFLPVPFDAKVQLLAECCNRRRCDMLASYGPYWKRNQLMRKYLPRLFRPN